MDIPLQRILFDGIRSMKDPVALRIGIGSMTDVLHLDSARRDELPELDASEAFVLSRVDGKSNVLDLLSVSSLPEVETLRGICALLSAGVVRAKASAPGRRDRNRRRGVKKIDLR